MGLRPDVMRMLSVARHHRGASFVRFTEQMARFHAREIQAARSSAK
jgi:hypothetical protein